MPIDEDDKQPSSNRSQLADSAELPKTVWDMRLRSGITVREVIRSTTVALIIITVFWPFYWWWVSVRDDHRIDERDIKMIPFGVIVYAILATLFIRTMRQRYTKSLAEFEQLKRDAVAKEHRHRERTSKPD